MSYGFVGLLFIRCVVCRFVICGCVCSVLVEAIAPGVLLPCNITRSLKYPKSPWHSSLSYFELLGPGVFNHAPSIVIN